MSIIETDRLILRQWKEEDLAPFAAINSDPIVMEFLWKCMTEGETAAMIEKIQRHFQKYGFGLFCAESKATSECIGFIGLAVPDFEAHFTPCVEIGWRLASQVWGQGLATEGARAVLKAGFEKYGLQEIVSFTVPANKRSISVMEKIGMKRDLKGDFHNPKVSIEHRLSLHVLYRITKEQYQNNNL
ncbi:MAG TPA: GNAT family N-acetyltransferase [Rhabdochlamydiaceae bacterium]